MPEPVQNQAWTIGQLLGWTAAWLERQGVDEPRLCAEILLAHAMRCRRLDLYTRFEHCPEATILDRFRDLVRRAGEHEPVAYLVGHKEFYSLDFEVTPAVLIPRPETEALVDRAITICRQADRAPVHLWDLGTGSACIAVAIAHFVPAARVLATDVSPDALEVAERNIARHALRDRIRTACADGPDIADDLVPPGGFDLIVSNPPYVSQRDRHRLPRVVRDYEPPVALYAGDDGMDMYRRLAAGTGHALRPGGRILLEVGYGQAQPVAALFEQAGPFRHVGTHRDPADPHDRVVELLWSP